MDNPTKQWISSSGLRSRAHKKRRIWEPFYAHEFNDHNTRHVLHDQSEVNGEPPKKIALDVENQFEVKVEPELLISVQDQINEGLEAKNTSGHKTTHVPRDETALEAQNQSEVKVKAKLNKGLAAKNTSGHKTTHVPRDETTPEAQNQSEVKVEPELLLSVQDQINEGLPAMNTSGHKTTHVSRDETAQEARNQSEVKVMAKLNKGLPAMNISGHKTTNVPRDKTAPEAQNQSKVKFKANLNKGLLATNTSDHQTTHVPSDETILEAQNQSVKCPMNEKKTEWVMLTTSVLLEAMSSVFDQVGYALMGMVIAFLALFLSSVYLICKARKEGVERSQPSGGLLDYYGLAAAVWQCFYSTMEYLYTRKNQQNPLKICLLPFMFALFVLLFSLFKCRT